MDRFHRRLLWPIRASGSEVIGFGARRIFDDDTMEAKYINTPETVLYKKSSVLFGLDLAKRDIAKGHQAVVVEGYTDVMAMHLAGVTTAVASCGTAFGDEHLSMLRRLMMDDNFFRGELIYVFDGDAAGRAAAVKAFEGEQNLAGQSFVAVADDGMDPCDLRLKSGDGALRDLVARRTPLFEFADSHRACRTRPRQCGRSGVGAAAVRADGGPDQRQHVARRVRPPVGRMGRLGRRRPSDRPGARGGAAARNAGPRQAPHRRRGATAAATATHPDRAGGPARSARIPRCGRSARRSSRRCSTPRWPGRCSTR